MKTTFSWMTNEIFYKKEIARLAVITTIFIAGLFTCIYWKTMPTVIHFIFIMIGVYIPFMMIWSLIRFIHISDNKKHFMILSNEDFKNVQTEYNEAVLDIYVDGKYLSIKQNEVLDKQKIYLLRINGKYFKKKDIKNIIL